MGVVEERRTGRTRPLRRWVSPGAGTWPRVAAVAGAVVLLALSVPLVCRAADVDGPVPVPQLLAFLPWLLAPATGGLLLVALARWPLGVVWAVLLAAATVWFLQPYGPRASAAKGRPVARVTLLSANIEYAQAMDELTAVLRRERPQLVSVQECDTRCVAALGTNALRAAYPYRMIGDVPGSAGSALLSAFPLSEQRMVPGEFSMPGATADVHGHPLRLQVVHPFPPMPRHMDAWRRDLGALREASAGRDRSVPTVFAGDFNSSQDHAAFRAILDTGLADAATLEGRSRTPTWPADSVLPALTQIDHVLVSEQLTPAKLRFVDLPSSDHRAVWVELEVRG